MKLQADKRMDLEELHLPSHSKTLEGTLHNDLHQLLLTNNRKIEKMIEQQSICKVCPLLWVLKHLSPFDLPVKAAMP